MDTLSKIGRPTEYMGDPGPCGNEWANQALFDYEGNTLKTWELIRDFKVE